MGDAIHITSDSITSDTVQIDKIFIIGYKKTKEHIIKRELSIADGQWISRADLKEMLEEDKRKLINTRLFLSVDINIVEWILSFA